jgi:Protein of unknown function (DUF1302)
MTTKYGKIFFSIAGVVLVAFFSSRAWGESILGEEWEKFFKEKVSFGGFVENTSGVSVGAGSHFFNTSNRFIMNRFTIQPEFNIDMAEWAKLFISWRFVAEPRYSAETKSREASVTYFPPQPVRPLIVTYYSEYSPVPWEAVLDVSPTDRLKLRIGRQFISWGETDGIRLLDVINPQNLRFSPPSAPNLFNLDESRIPSWGLRALYTVRPVSNTILEFFALPGSLDFPEQRVDEFMAANDTTDRKVRYGRWSAHPETRLMLAGRNAFGNLLANPIIGPGCFTMNPATCVILPTTSRELPDAGDSWKIGTRVTHAIGKLNLGLGYIWGFNPQASDMVFKLRSTRLIQCPNTAPPVPPLCTQAFASLVNDRTNIFAGHFNYTVDQLATIPVNTAIRGEMAFYPNQPYNISQYPGAFGLKASANPKFPDGTVEKNTLRYALGFDRSTLIPFLQDDPWRPFRMSFQIFQRIIFDHEDGIRPFNTATRIRTVTTNLTFRVSTGYLGDTILPDVFVSYDPAGYWSANPAVTYAPPWNEKISLSLIGAFYGGHNKFANLGLFSEKDSIFLKMRYQF